MKKRENIADVLTKRGQTVIMLSIHSRPPAAPPVDTVDILRAIVVEGLIGGGLATDSLILCGVSLSVIDHSDLTIQSDSEPVLLEILDRSCQIAAWLSERRPDRNYGIPGTCELLLALCSFVNCRASITLGSVGCDPIALSVYMIGELGCGGDRDLWVSSFLRA